MNNIFGRYAGVREVNNGEDAEFYFRCNFCSRT